MPFEFRTVVNTGTYDNAIDVGTNVFLAGSCFTDNIGAKFSEYRLSSMVNPFGVVYNPVSVARLLERTKNLEYCRPDELVQLNGLWHHFDFHGRFSGEHKDGVCNKINQSLADASQFLKESGFLILTFGTSYVYERNDTSEVVANCHKFPSQYFSRYRLEPDEIVSLYKDLIVSLRLFNPQLKILFTVSPVRHWKDGAHANQVSKSALFLAIDKLCDLFDKAWYFPAYEIVMDELRDYRFYDDKMFNPSALAIDYIWNRFSQTLLTERAAFFTRLTSKVVRARNHRFLGPPGQSYYQFLQKNLDLIDDILYQFPEADLLDDSQYFETLLNRNNT